MKRDKLFRLSLAILFLWTSLALAAPAAMAASSTALPGSSLWEPYLQQSRIDLEKAASSPWETLKSFLPRSFGALVRQTASRYTSVLLFLTLTAVLGLLAGECTDGASSASESILAGIQLLKSGLGLAALSVLGAEFVPLYLGLMIQLALLMGCSLLCSLTGISRCRALFDCFAEAVRCMAAVVALFFGLAAAGVALLFIVGGGS